MAHYLREGHWLVAVLVVALVLGGCANPTPAQTASPAQAEPRRAAADGGVSAEAEIVPLQQADLRFKASGTVDQILVSEGGRVTAGQELARLEVRDLEAAVAQAQAALHVAQAQLAKARAGARPEERAAAQAGLAIVQAAETAAEQAVGVAQSDLAAAQADAQAAGQAVQAAQGNLASGQAALRAAQANLDKLKAGPTQTDIQIAEQQVEGAKSELYYKQQMRDLRGIGETVYSGELEALEIQVDLAELALEQLKAGARPEDLAKAAAQVAQAQAGVQTAIGQVARAQAQVNLAQAGVQTAQARVAAVLAQAQGATAQVQQVQAQLDLLTAGARPEEIAAAEAQTARAEASLAGAQNALEDAVLRAPFDGTVGAILVHAGETAGPQTLAMRLGDLSRLRAVTRDLSEVDVGRVQGGTKATVSVDALGGRQFPATVVRVAPLATERLGDKVYAVLLDLDATPDSGLRWGMSAFVDFSGGAAPSAVSVAAPNAVAGGISAQGEVLPYRQADLSFRVGGRVAQVLVSEGELVSAGQELARLDPRDLEQAVQQARAGMQAAQAQLDLAQAGARLEEVAAAEAKLAIAQAGVLTAQRGIEVAEGGLAAAQANVELTQAAVVVAQGNLAAARSARSIGQADLDRIQNGPTVLDLKLAEKQVELAKQELWIVQNLRDATRNLIGGKIGAAQAQLAIAQLQLDALKAGARPEDRTAAQAQVEQAQAGVQSAVAQLAQDGAVVTRMTAGAQAAQAQVAQAQAQLRGAEAQAQQAAAELDLLKAGSRAEDVAAAQAQVAQAQAGLAAAQSALADTVLRAPFDGTVGEVLAHEGELVSLQLAVLRLGDLSQLRVKTLDLSEVDVSHVEVGQAATVTVDALGGRTFAGTVLQVALLATEQRGSAVYTVEIDLGAPPEPSPRWGMTAFVEIQAP